MKHLLYFIFAFAIHNSFAQTWSGEVAEIFYQKCAKCHHDGGGGPFPLMSYSEANNMASSIYDAVYQGTMPPWPPDESSAEFLHDRSLNESEKTTILNWLTAGTPEGNPSETPPPPVFNEGTILGPGDLEVQIPTYASKAISMDDYVCFSLPINLTEDRIIKAVEVIPGNPEIVHHVLVYVDQDGTEVTDTLGGDCASPSNLNSKLVGGFTPGATPIIFPSQDPIKLGVHINAGAKIYLNMHYPIGSYGMVDSTRVIFHFYPPSETDVREIDSDPLLINYQFILPPEQITSVSAQYPSGSSGSPADYSLYSVFPHMHLLGKEIGAFAVSPEEDTLNLIHIPHWDFDWQDFYKFRYLQKIPQGSKLHSYGTFDNTSLNIHNPFSPPQTVTFGLNTTDEMFITYFQYLPYIAGDENYDLTELTALGIQEVLTDDTDPFQVFPNPFSNHGVDIVFREPLDSKAQIIIYDNRGNRVSELRNFEHNKVHWDGKNAQNQEVRSGVYFISVNQSGTFTHKKLIKTR